MKIFITGATGFIGTNLVRALAQRGHTVHALYRDEARLAGLGPGNIIPFKGSLEDPEALERAAEGCEQVYHVAAYARPWARDPDVFYRVNTEGSRRILETASQTGIRKMVFISTAGVFGSSRNASSITEDQPYPEHYFTHYDRSKKNAEELLLNYPGSTPGIVVVNPTRVFGPGPLIAGNATARIIASYISGHWHFVPGNGRSVGNYVYIDDVVGGIIKAMEFGKPRRRYLIGGEDAGFRELLDLVARISGKKYRQAGVPLSLLLFASRAATFWARISGSEPLLVPDFVRKLSHDFRISSRRAMDELSYHPRPLEAGIEETIKWIRETKQA